MCLVLVIAARAAYSRDSVANPVAARSTGDWVCSTLSSVSNVKGTDVADDGETADPIAAEFLAATLQLMQAAQRINELATDQRFIDNAETIGEMLSGNYVLVAQTVDRVLEAFDA